MKIAFVIGMLGAGGAERVVTLLCNSLQASGNDVSLYTFDGVGREFFPLDRGVRRVGFDLLAETYGLERVRANARRVRRLRQQLRDDRPDVLVSFVTQANVIALVAAAGLGIPVVISERVDPRAHREPLPWRVMRRLIYRRAAYLVVQTDAVRAWGARLLGEGRVVTIPNPVSPATQASASMRLPGPDVLQVVAMGRLVTQKGFDLLIEAFTSVAREIPTASLVIYGEGPERNSLQARARALGIEGRVSFPGQAERAADALGAASLFVLSSRYEGFPNVLLEAMSLSRPVVAFDCPSGPGEIIRHDVDGLLVPANDVAALSAAMTRVLSDAQLRLRIAAAAAEVNERFSPRRVLAQWQRVLKLAVDYA